jgi:AraC-like DNA-binding protein
MATPQDSAYFEHIQISEEQSFLWRLDDYPWQRCVWNYHPQAEIHLIRYSSGLCFVGDHIGDFNAGQLVLVGGNLPHNWVSPAIGERKLIGRDIVIQFDHARFEGAAAVLPELKEVGGLFKRAAYGVEFFGETARRGEALIEGMADLSGVGRLGVFIELLSLMAESTEYRTLATPEFLGLFRPGSIVEIETLEKALAFIHETYLERSSLSDVAALVGMSDSAFSRFFKKHTGNTYSNHVISLRLLMARKLLTETERPVTDICYETGFSNISNFNRAFLQRIGMTPSRYRRASRSRSLKGHTGETSAGAPGVVPGGRGAGTRLEENAP